MFNCEVPPHLRQIKELKRNKNWTPRPEFASELYLPSDSLLSTRLVTTFVDKMNIDKFRKKRKYKQESYCGRQKISYIINNCNIAIISRHFIARVGSSPVQWVAEWIRCEHPWTRMDKNLIDFPASNKLKTFNIILHYKRACRLTLNERGHL
jgi:hypothetical protein